MALLYPVSCASSPSTEILCRHGRCHDAALPVVAFFRHLNGLAGYDDAFVRGLCLCSCKDGIPDRHRTQIAKVDP